MKVVGRKTSGAYELYGFIPKVDNGKHSAICTSCNRVLQNTAAVRLQKHRNSCVAARASDSINFPNIEIKRRKAPNVEAVQQLCETVHSNVKTEQSNMEFDDANINDNENTTYEDTVDNLHDYIPSRKSTTKNDKTNIKLKAKIQYFKEKSKYFLSEMDNLKFEKTMMVLKVKKLRLEIKQLETTNTAKRLYKTTVNDEINNTSTVSEPCTIFDHEENPIQSPLTVHLEPTDPFESYNATISNNLVPEINDEMHQVNEEDLINIEEELDVIQNLMPRSKESKQLQDELSKAETEYYRCKAAYFTKLTENCKVKRTLMLLESRKLQLEIEKLTNEC